MFTDNQITSLYLADHPYTRKWNRPFKWNVRVNVLTEYRLFKRLPEFAEWNRDDHVRESREALREATELRFWYYQSVRALEIKYGDHGPLISGIVREHFPNDCKVALRQMCREINFHTDRSIAHWQYAGKRLHTWRETRDAIEQMKGITNRFPDYVRCSINVP